ncbi:MAG: terminase [Novosphingobium sp. 28-62-57]|uniref:phage terminase large subunit n=1 Tax=Novosphingobium sp. 28-62-57 TaxID=1970409 RepID=UPI000BCAFCEF|nr:phage terminase large subunit [Novosphingobium sp. 28-62-57]OYZ07699.1 MAG: terminase [Novosphingobium sp. 28-62-57]OYZ43435.1 MAG: terminase [Novosphingobium sp. 16-62-11]OZA30505.1 MAG: terminase [Novosphingobium sp. 17-62-9]HQS96699.1 phage terminase large subunit [Novosphingobium sp.]
MNAHVAISPGIGHNGGPAIVDGQTIKPQPGPQTAFLASSADIVIYGGGAGGGKTWGLLMEPLRHIGNSGFGAVFFRRSTVQIRNEGGLWDESAVLYPQVGGDPKEHTLSWSFPSGASVSFAHLEHDKTRFNWQGSQIPLICFDELTHFSAVQFWYMVSRNRSMCSVRPYIRATCNPDADSWVAELIAWWIDQDTGLPIPERSGVVRWFVRVGEDLRWADDPTELEQYTMLNEDGETVPIPPKSLTFIPAKLTDNKALMAADPGYMASLLSLPLVERERLLGGNWKIRPAAGLYFQRSWCQVVDAIPVGTVFCRGYDLGATARSAENPDPDATSSTKVGRMPSGRYIVVDSQNECLSPAGVERLIKNTATQDGKACKISLPQDPGQAGKSQVANFKLNLSGYNVRSSTETGDKITRFSPFSAQAEGGNVDVLRGAWNERWFSALENFPTAKHDDDPDSTSRAFEGVALGGRYNLSALT